MKFPLVLDLAADGIPVAVAYRVLGLSKQAFKLDIQRWSTRADLRLAIVTWIEKTYHRKRRQRRLGRLTPVEFEILNSGLKAA